MYVIIVPRILTDLSGPEFILDLQNYNEELHGLPHGALLYRSTKKDLVMLGGKQEPRFRVFIGVTDEGEAYLVTKGHFLQTLTTVVKVNLLQQNKGDH